MRHIAKDVCGRGHEAQSRFAELMSEREPLSVQRWTALHVLELCSLGPDVEARAIQAIERAAAMDVNEALNDRVWLRRWRASQGSRTEFVLVLCLLPVDYHEANLSPVDLLRAGRFASNEPATATEIEACLRSAPDLVDAWEQYSDDQRCSPAWFVTQRPDGQFGIGRSPSGEREWFADRVQAVSEFAARSLRDLFEHAA
jgi:hypothetical protein